MFTYRCRRRLSSKLNSSSAVQCASQRSLAVQCAVQVDLQHRSRGCRGNLLTGLLPGSTLPGVVDQLAQLGGIQVAGVHKAGELPHWDLLVLA